MTPRRRLFLTAKILGALYDFGVSWNGLRNHLERLNRASDEALEAECTCCNPKSNVFVLPAAILAMKNPTEVVIGTRVYSLR